MSVGRICVREVDTAGPDESIYLVAERMHQRAVGALVVVNHDSEPIGIVTDRDLMARVLAKGLGPTETVVRDVMTPNPTLISEDDAIESALALMRAGRFRRLPVVDGEQKLVSDSRSLRSSVPSSLKDIAFTRTSFELVASTMTRSNGPCSLRINTG